MKVLITGGAGYIGSTVASACSDAGITPVILDDLSAGRRDFAAAHSFYEGEVADGTLIDRVYSDHPDIEAVVHCAARIVVPESVQQPLRYYRTNVADLVELVGHLLRNDCRRVLFSSSASMYAPGPDFVVDEDSPLRPTSPYAATKMMAERILADVTAATSLRVLSLRYFNPVGADPQLRTGPYDPRPSHAMGQLLQADRAGRPFAVTGADWPTRDGSAIRDYIHVWDLARAHIAALLRFDAVVPAGYEAVNVGTGCGTTVWELVRAFERASGRSLEVRVAPPRPGDVVGSYTRRDKAERLLGWVSERTVEDGVRDALAWDARQRTSPPTPGNFLPASG